jgi:hypothetical protein
MRWDEPGGVGERSGDPVIGTSVDRKGQNLLKPTPIWDHLGWGGMSREGEGPPCYPLFLPCVLLICRASYLKDTLERC